MARKGPRQFVHLLMITFNESILAKLLLLSREGKGMDRHVCASLDIPGFSEAQFQTWLTENLSYPALSFHRLLALVHVND